MSTNSEAQSQEARAPQDWLAYAWACLVRGARRAGQGFHTGQLATVGADGAPQVRTVVLRAADPEARLVLCHTDLRSAKLAEIAAQPRVAWHFHEPALKLQLRLSGTASRHVDDALAEARWQASSPGSRRCYLTGRAPGSPLAQWDSGLPPGVVGRRPSVAETLPGRVHFAVVSTQVDLIDVLWLSSQGHRRVRFHWEGGWRGGWVSP